MSVVPIPVPSGGGLRDTAFHCRRFVRRALNIGRRQVAAPVAVVMGTVMGSAGSTAEAGAIADFYHGKTVRLVVSSGAGGGTDTYGRLVARHLQRFIPGNPDVIVHNMPGAGGIKAGNYLYRHAGQDGTVIGSLQSSAPFEPLLGAKTARFDSLAFNWLGSPTGKGGAMPLWHSEPLDSLADVAASSLFGSAGLSATPAFQAMILKAALAAQLDSIDGYPGGAEIFHALKRLDGDGYSGIVWDGLTAERPDWMVERQVMMMPYDGARPRPDVADLPMTRDLARSAADRLWLDAALAPLAIGRPYLAPPNVPGSRVAALRAALMGTFRDVALMKEAEKLRLEFDLTPRTGEEIRRVLTRTYSAPKAVLQRLAALYDLGQRQAGSGN